MADLKNKRLLLGVTGGIAAYKSAELVRRLQDEGAEVRVAMSSAATHFITPLTMQALSGHPVHLDLMDAEIESAMGHIELARWADLVLVAPATADFIARFTFGHGDDLLSTLCLAATCPIAIAPAMNQAMWAKASTQSNMARLAKMEACILAPEEGTQACGESGIGRLMEPEKIVAQLVQLFQTGLLAGKHLVITAGPTREAIDPVRYISNRSSGKQGYALVTAALEAGAEVTLITGPTHLPRPERARVIEVNTAEEMLAATMRSIEDAEVFIGVAAVADYRPANTARQKLKKEGTTCMQLELVQNPDILTAVAASPARPFTVGFAAETEDLVKQASAKLNNKQVDMIIANNVADDTIGFDAEDNQVTVLISESVMSADLRSADGLSKAVILEPIQALPRMSKDALARKIITIIATAIGKV